MEDQEHEDTNNMSTVQRRRGQSLHLDLAGGPSEDLPPIAALFLVLFDVKAGYTIAWKRSIPGLVLDNSVEYKSLPSGLHHVTEDLIYFVHQDEYAGLSAFINEPSENANRKALMLAVGALVPLSYGRLGKSWKYAQSLKDLASALAKDPSGTRPLEEFWIAHQITDDASRENDTHPESPSIEKTKRNGSQVPSQSPVRTRRRGMSTVSALAPPGRLLSPYHPALSLPDFLDIFGPLVFPILKAALLRRRILIVGHASVELSCNFVYDISILSGIPSTVVDLLPLEPLPVRLQALFSVGVHDLSSLSSASISANGWAACTTDDILASKPQVYDTLITLPPLRASKAQRRAWAHLKTNRGVEIKATQRDLRRYQVLRQSLHTLASSGSTLIHSPYTSMSTAKKRNSLTISNFPPDMTTSADDIPSGENPPGTFINDDDGASAIDADVVEPQSWSALAYDSFMWWASAGAKRTDLDEEEEADREMFAPVMVPGTAVRPSFANDDGANDRDAAAAADTSSRRRSSGLLPSTAGASATAEEADMDNNTTNISASGAVETSIIAYFHHFTERILKVLAAVIDPASSEDDDDDEEGEFHDAEYYDSDNALVDNEDDEGVTGQQRISENGNSSGKHPQTTTAGTAPAPSPSETAALLPQSNQDGDSQGNDDDETVEISSDDMTRMGLDIWSESDRVFVIDLVALYWGRKCVVRRGGVECCGVRIC